eukprot:9019115-Pyramimonas_sp.AAC.1
MGGALALQGNREGRTLHIRPLSRGGGCCWPLWRTAAARGTGRVLSCERGGRRGATHDALEEGG